jgi:hypothetical protein
LNDIRASVQAHLADAVPSLDSLVMGVSSALGCVVAEDIYLAPTPEQPRDSDATAVIYAIQPAIDSGTVIGPWEQQLLGAAGIPHVSVIPQPRVVVVGVEHGDAVARTAALASTLVLSGVLALSAAADGGPDLEDVIDDQLVRADLLLICEADGARGRVDSVLAALGSTTTPLWTANGLPDVRFALLGAEKVPTLVLPADPKQQLIAFVVAVQPLLAVLVNSAPTSHPHMNATVGHTDAGLGAPLGSQVSASEIARGLGAPLSFPNITCRVVAATGEPVGPRRPAHAVVLTDESGSSMSIPLPQPPLHGLLAAQPDR